MKLSIAGSSCLGMISFTIALSLVPRRPAAGRPEVARRPAAPVNLGEGPVITEHLH